MTDEEVKNYQDRGFVEGLGDESLLNANNLIKSAREATPEKIRDRFRSYVNPTGVPTTGQNGYIWGWVLK